MNGFTLVKEAVSAKNVAEHYGLKVNNKGMICCPFHEDKHPSMKVDSRYFCFGCGTTGDSIDLAGKLLALSPFESMTRLAQDFGVDIWNKGKLSSDKGKIIPFNSSIKSNSVSDTRATVSGTEDVSSVNMKKWTAKAVRVLLRYRDYLRTWKIVYAPDKADDDWHTYFEESLALQDKVTYWLDILLFGEEYEKELIYEDLREEVKKLEQRFFSEDRN